MAPMKVEEQQTGQLDGGTIGDHDAPSSAMGRMPGASLVPGWAARIAPVAQPALVALCLIVGTTLLLIAAVPQTAWQSMGLSADGPVPQKLVPVEAALFYFTPTLVGVLCRRWQVALILATAPAWIDLGVFVVSAAAQLGPFYLTQNHPDGGVGLLELYGALGAFGWLARSAVLLVWEERARRMTSRDTASGSRGAR
jgi:hypothetical protein